MKESTDQRVERLLNALLYNHLTLSAAGAESFVHLGVQGLIDRVALGISVLEHFGEWFHLGIDPQDLFYADPGDQTAQDVLGLDDRYLQLYQCRIEDLLQREEFQAASSVALLLTVLRSKDPMAWITYALAEQLCGRYTSSACAFTAAIHCGADEHDVMYYSAQGYIQLGKVESAKKILERIIVLTHNEESKKDLRAVVFKMLAHI